MFLVTFYCGLNFSINLKFLLEIKSFSKNEKKIPFVSGKKKKKNKPQKESIKLESLRKTCLMSVV